MKNKLFIKIGVMNLIAFATAIMSVIMTFNILSYIEKNTENIKQDAKNLYRYQIDKQLNSIRFDLINQFKKDKIDFLNDQEIKQWCNQNILEFSTVDKFSYPIMFDITTGNIIWSSNPYKDNVPSNISGLIYDTKAIDDIISQYNIKAPSNKMYDKLKTIQLSHPEIYKQLKRDGSIYIDNLDELYVIENEIKSSSDSDYDNKSIVSINGKRKIIDWVIIPIGRNGFNDESPTVNGKENPKYKKIAMLTITSEEEVYSFFNKSLTINKIIKILAYIVMAMLVFLCFGVATHYMELELEKECE